MSCACLLLFEGVLADPFRWMFLYGCLAESAAMGPPQPAPLEALAISAERSVIQVRVAIEPVAAQAIRTALAEGALDFTLFGAQTIGAVPAIGVGRPHRVLQPEAAIARRWTADDRSFGVPPGFFGTPTVVESFLATGGWSPPARDPAGLVATPSARTPVEPAIALLEQMAQLSGLPFDGAYAERMRCFEVILPTAGPGTPEVRWRIARGSSGNDSAVVIDVIASVPSTIHIVLRIEGETIVDRLEQRSAASAPTINIATATPPDEIEVRVFDTVTGDLLTHRRFIPIFNALVSTTVQGGSARLRDAIARRSPPDRRDAAADVSRTATETTRLGDTAEAAERVAHAARMRKLVRNAADQRCESEWFPRGIGGELDAIERLRGWAEDPAVDELIIVDPFTSPATVTRLLRRIRENMSITVVSSLSTEDAVNDLRRALDHHAVEFACRLRVVNVVENRGCDAEGVKRTGGQAFHDRYVIVFRKDGSQSTYVLTNSLNNAAGKWPLVIASLSMDVASRVQAYTRGLLRGVDLAGGLPLEITLEWTNTSSKPARGGTSGSRRGPESGPTPGFRMTHDALRTLAWLAGAIDWAKARSSVPGRLRSTKVRLKALLARAFGARLIRRRRGGGFEIHGEAIGTALRRAVRLMPPHTAEELAIVLGGLGEVEAWSQLSMHTIVAALKNDRTRRHLRRALAEVAGRVRLQREGSEEYEVEDLHKLPLGRRLVWRTGAALNEMRARRSPDYGLTGAIWAGFGIDAGRTLAWLHEDAPPLVREVGLDLIYKDLNPCGPHWTFPAVLRAPRLSVRIAGVVYMDRPHCDGGPGLSLGEAAERLRDAGWTREDQTWGMTIAFAAAFLRLAQLRTRSPLDLYGAMEAEVAAAAAAVAAVWPAMPNDALLDGIADIFDQSGEKLLRLGDAVVASGGDAGGIYRRCLRAFDDAIGVKIFAEENPTARDHMLDEDRADVSLSDALPLWAAIAYIRLTGNQSVTKRAGRYIPLLEHCERQVHDILFRNLREREWSDRIFRLTHLYRFVYRILDEAARVGLTEGTTWFAQDVGSRVLKLLAATENGVEEFSVNLALLARDFGRAHLLGLFAVATGRPTVVRQYLDAVAGATQMQPDFHPLETFASLSRHQFVGAVRPGLAALLDSLDRRAKLGLPTQVIEDWWQAFCERADIPDIRRWSELIAGWAAHSSSQAAQSVTPMERFLGFRLGEP